MCTLITHCQIYVMLLCYLFQAAQLAPAENKQCHCIGAGAEALFFPASFHQTLPAKPNSYAYFSKCQIMSTYILFSLFLFSFIGFELNWIETSQDIYNFYFYFYSMFCLSFNYTRRKYDCQSWVMETLYLLWWLWNSNGVPFLTFLNFLAFFFFLPLSMEVIFAFCYAIMVVNH